LPRLSSTEVIKNIVIKIGGCRCNRTNGFAKRVQRIFDGRYQDDIFQNDVINGGSINGGK